MQIIIGSERQNCCFIYTTIKRWMNEYLVWMVLPLFHITVVLKSTWNNEDVGVWKSFVEAQCFHSLCWRESRRGTPEVLSSLYPSFSTSWDLGVAPAASVLASRNWHWVHCLQWEAHGCGLKVHSWDQNAVWNTNSLCALAALFPWLPHPHQASRTKLPPLAHVSTCGLSFYSHPHILMCHFDDEVQADI